MQLNTDKFLLELWNLFSVLQKNQQRIRVADFSATRMHLVQNPQIPKSSPATPMRWTKNLQRRCVAGLKTCT
jgi:hypothetical protein